jgi:hypothetical protein
MVLVFLYGLSLLTMAKRDFFVFLPLPQKGFMFSSTDLQPLTIFDTVYLEQLLLTRLEESDADLDPTPYRSKIRAVVESFVRRDGQHTLADLLAHPGLPKRVRTALGTA